MKKLLALVLALVMSLSLVTISNAAFADAEDIDLNEAVEVLNAVGVLAGDEKGNFNAKAELTREQAAKIIAYLALGEDVAEALPAVKVFNDVEADRWSAKYIAYCADAGYLAGVGEGNFDPAGKLTGYAFGKMLLCALGYDAAIEQFTGASWQIKVSSLMSKNDIAKGVDKSGSAVLTREEAAQYALNALKAICVEYENKGSTIIAGDVTVIGSASKAEQVENKGNTDVIVEDDLMQLGEQLYKGDLVLAEDEGDELGRPAHKWSYDKFDGTYADKADKVYYGAVKASTIYKDFKLDKDTTVDLVCVADSSAPATLKITKNGGDVAFIGTGFVTEAFKDGDDITLVTYKYESVKLTDAMINDADEDDEDSKRSISFTGVDVDYETESFEKDDILLYTVGENEDSESVALDVQKADSIEGKVTAVKGSNYTIDGATYKSSIALKVGDKGTFFLNVDGSVVDYDKEDSATGKYAYIYAVTKDDDGKDEDGNKKTVYTAYYFDADGVKASAKLYEKDGKILDTTIPTDLDDLVGMYEYKLTDDGMKKVDNAKIDSAEADLSKTKIGTKYADDSTKFVFVYENDDGVQASKVVNGFKNVEKYDAAETVYYVTGSTKFITNAFVIAKAADAESDELYAVLFDDTAEISEDEDENALYTYTVYVDGKKTSLTFESELTGISEGAAFAYKMGDTNVKDGSVKTLDKKTNTDLTYVTGQVDEVAGNDVYTKANTNYAIADDAVIYVVKTLTNGDLKVSTGEFKADNNFVALVNEDDEIVFAVIDLRA